MPTGQPHLYGLALEVRLFLLVKFVQKYFLSFIN